MKRNIFVLIIMIGLLLTLSSCIIHPLRLDDGAWYFQSVIIDEKYYYPGDYTKEFEKEYIYDYCLFKFNEDETIVVSKYYSGEVVARGTYLAKDKQIFIDLDNGDSFVGTCNQFMFDGVWYEFELSNGNIKLNLNEGGRGYCEYSKSLDEYFVYYNFDNIEELSDFFFSDDKYIEMQDAVASLKDNRISENFISFYNKVRNSELPFFFPSICDEDPKSITLHTSNQYNKPWLTFIRVNVGGKSINYSIMILDEDLSRIDKELSELLNINGFAKKYFWGYYYNYFIYEIPNSGVKILVRLLENVGEELLNNIDYYTKLNLSEIIDITEINNNEEFKNYFNALFIRSNGYIEIDGKRYRNLVDELIYVEINSSESKYYDYFTNELIAVKYTNKTNVYYFDNDQVFSFTKEMDFIKYYTYLDYSKK